MTAVLALGRFSNELLASLGCTFTQHPDRRPTIDDGADERIDRALDELASNAVAIRAVTLAGVTGIAALARESITLRRHIDEALAAGGFTTFDDGWAVRLVHANGNLIADIELFRCTRSLAERFQ